MRKNVNVLAVAAMLTLPTCVMAANSQWYNPKTWFGKDKVSTTVTGSVASIIKGEVLFTTTDGQSLLLLGSKANKVGECGTDAKIRVFGNVYQPSEKYPAGALQVRNYRVLEEGTEAVAEAAQQTVSEPAALAEPEPYEEPVLESSNTTTEPVVEEEPTIEVTAVNAEDTKDDVAVKVDDNQAVKTYVVASGDTLGKISSKLLGSSTSWKKIAELNGITNPKHLKVGMTLKLPQMK